MTEPTEADRERAVRVAAAMGQSLGAPSVAPIAAALAEERERARAQFLALADDLDQRADALLPVEPLTYSAGAQRAYGVVAVRIRAIVEETP